MAQTIVLRSPSLIGFAVAVVGALLQRAQAEGRILPFNCGVPHPSPLTVRVLTFPAYVAAADRRGLLHVPV